MAQADPISQTLRSGWSALERAL